jgi:hypothetical protein
MPIKFLNNVAVDSSVLYVDTINDRVGIGTTSPDATLKVQGPSDTATISTSSTPAARINNGGAISLWIGSNFYNYGYVQSIQDDGSNNLKPLSLQPLGGDVGIGTTSPSQKLDVNGNIISTSGSGNFIRSKHSVSAFAQLESNSSGGIVKGSGGNGFLIRSYGDSYFNGGNVGIGTTSPSTLLDVRGEVSVAYDASYGLRFYNDARNNWSFIGNNVSGSSSANLRFGDATGEVMRITGGNVGIGTDSPETRLHVKGPADDNESLLTIENTHSSGGIFYPAARFIHTHSNHSYGHVAEFITEDSAGTDRPSILFSNSHSDHNWAVGQGVYGANDNFAIGYRSFKVQNSSGWSTARLVIDTSGNVGIGTTSPNARLHVYNTGNGEIEVERASGALINIQAQSAKGVVGTDSNHTFSLKTNSSERLTISSGGNVGIGTTSPDVKLEVIAASPTDGIIADFVNSTNAGGTTAAIKLSNADSEACDVVLGANRVGANFGSDFFISLSDSVDGSNQERFRITEAGNVGIGTTSPIYQLTLGGNAVGSTQGLRINDPSNAAYGAHFSFSDTPNEVWIGGITNNTYNSTIGIHRDATRAITIDVGGKVGIGTTSPSYKLSVNGVIQSDIIKGYTYPNNSFLDFDDDQTASSNNTTLASIGRILYLADTNNNSPADSPAHEFFTGTVDIDTATSLMVIETNGNVGIGTTNPATKLHIGTLSTSGVTTEEFRIQSGTSSGNGGTAIANLVTGSFGTSGIYFGNQSTYTSQDAYLKYADSNNTTTLNFSAILNLESGSSGSRMYINSAGNVGIGTTSPSGLLDVSNGTNSIFIESGGTYPELNADVVLRIGQRTEIWGDGTGRHYLDVRDPNGNQNIKLNGEGNSFFSNNLGIGTTSPSEKLHVVGSALIEGSSTELKVKGSGGYDTANIVMGNAAKSDIFSIDTRNDPGGNYTTLSFDSYQTTGTSTITLGDNYVNLGTAGSSRVTINSTGNVGIGTTDPAADLHIHDEGGLAAIRLSGTASGADNFQITQGVIGLNNAGFSIYDVDATASRLVIDTSGNVGIGTTDPRVPLQVSSSAVDTDFLIECGNTQARMSINNTSTGDSQINFQLGNTSRFTMGVDNSDSDKFKISGGAALGSSDRIVVDSTGNVGIATTSPGAKLDVDGNFKLSDFTATAVATSGSLSPNQNYQASSQDTLADLAVDPSGNVVRGMQEGTWTFTAAQLNTSLGNTLIEAPGVNKAVIVYESSWMIKYNATGAINANQRYEIRQASNTGIGPITQLPGAKINEILSQGQSMPGGGASAYGFYSRDVPADAGGRTFKTNTATTLHRNTNSTLPSGVQTISIKLRYRIYNANTF